MEANGKNVEIIVMEDMEASGNVAPPKMAKFFRSWFKIKCLILRRDFGQEQGESEGA